VTNVQGFRAQAHENVGNILLLKWLESSNPADLLTAQREFRSALLYNLRLEGAWRGLSYSFLKQGDFLEAIAVIGQSPIASDLLIYYRAESEAQLGRLDMARRDWLQVRAFPRLRESYFREGTVELEANRPALARVAFKQAYETAQMEGNVYWMAEALRLIAASYRYEGRWEDGIVTAKQALELMPALNTALAELGYLLFLGTHDCHTSISLISQAYVMAPDNNYYLSLLDTVAMECGRDLR